MDLFCRFIIARHNKKTKEFSEILSVSHALPHRGQYPQSEYGRHLQFVQAAGKNAQANCVCSGAHCAAVGGFAALRMRRPLYGEGAPLAVANFEAVPPTAPAIVGERHAAPGAPLPTRTGPR